MMCQEHFLPTVIAEPTKPNDLRFTIYPIGLALSAVFLAATLAAGAILPASHHVLHWRCQINHVACLLVGDVLLCITHLSGRMNPAVCFTVGKFLWKDVISNFKDYLVTVYNGNRTLYLYLFFD